MDELPSTDFRKRFPRLMEPTLVTVNGHPIGFWTPYRDPTLQMLEDHPNGLAMKKAIPQAQRDAILNKINKPREKR